MVQLPAPVNPFPVPDCWPHKLYLRPGGRYIAGVCADSVLLFANHRRFLADDQDWTTIVSQLRRQAPEKKIIVEAETPREAQAALRAQPDVVQLDKFTPVQAAELARIAPILAPDCTLALTGGINLVTLTIYLNCGIRLFITSALYYAPPADIRVILSPDVTRNQSYREKES